MFSNKSKINWTNWHHRLHKEFLNETNLIPESANLLIAVSGGQDSMALMTLINDIKYQHYWTIHVWHGDHKWHKESTLFANQLKNYCIKKEINFHSDIAEKEEILTEEKARNWRYKKLCQKVDELLIDGESIQNWYILTGHTSSDNTETFFLNLARGSNFNGLAGIANKRILNDKYTLIRPILIFSRKETLSICETMKIPFWEDPTNNDLSIKRNQIRKNIIPYLEEIYPGSTKRINQFIKKMSHFKNEQKDLSRLALETCKNSEGLDREIFKKLGPEAKSTLLNTFICEKSTKQINSKNIDELSIKISNKYNGQKILPNGLKIIWNKKTIKLEN